MQSNTTFYPLGEVGPDAIKCHISSNGWVRTDEPNATFYPLGEVGPDAIKATFRLLGGVGTDAILGEVGPDAIKRHIPPTGRSRN